jgi:hypothetical protein
MHHLRRVLSCPSTTDFVQEVLDSIDVFERENGIKILPDMRQFFSIPDIRWHVEGSIGNGGKGCFPVPNAESRRMSEFSDYWDYDQEWWVFYPPPPGHNVQYLIPIYQQHQICEVGFLAGWIKGDQETRVYALCCFDDVSDSIKQSLLRCVGKKSRIAPNRGRREKLINTGKTLTQFFIDLADRSCRPAKQLPRSNSAFSLPPSITTPFYDFMVISFLPFLSPDEWAAMLHVNRQLRAVFLSPIKVPPTYVCKGFPALPFLLERHNVKTFEYEYGLRVFSGYRTILPSIDNLIWNMSHFEETNHSDDGPVAATEFAKVFPNINTVQILYETTAQQGENEEDEEAENKQSVNDEDLYENSAEYDTQDIIDDWGGDTDEDLYENSAEYDTQDIIDDWGGDTDDNNSACEEEDQEEHHPDCKGEQFVGSSDIAAIFGSYAARGWVAHQPNKFVRLADAKIENEILRVDERALDHAKINISCC